MIGSAALEHVDLMLVTPVPQPGMLRGGPPLQIPLDATREVATMYGTDTASLTEHPYWQELVARVEAAAADAMNPDRQAQVAALGWIEEDMGDRRVVFGSWHGDWTPWNMASAQGLLYVWDWERARRDVPVGIDLMHFDFDVRVKIRHQEPGPAAEEGVMAQAPNLEQLGLPSGSARLAMAIHLLEMSLRFHQARASGLALDDPIYAPALQNLMPRAADVSR